VSNLYPRSKVLWSLAASGLGTTISGAGNSGDWAGNGPGDILPQADFETPVDLRDIQDVALFVNVGGITGTPAFTVTLNVFDDLGNAYATSLTSGSIATARTVAAYAGLHGAGASEYLVPPSWGQVAWTQTGAGASVTGVQIELCGR
jgi:hypothetical protein